MRIFILSAISLFLVVHTYAISPFEMEKQYYDAHDAYYSEKNASKSEKLIDNLLIQAPAHTYSNQARLLLAEIYLDTKRLSHAQAILMNALAFRYPSQSNENLMLQAAVYKQAGLVEKALQHFDLAERYLIQSKAIYERYWPHSEEMGNILVKLGNVYLKNQKLAEAKETYIQAKAIWISHLAPQDTILVALSSRIKTIEDELQYKESFNPNQPISITNPYSQYSKLSERVDKGQWYLSRGYKAEAIEHFNQALKEAILLYGPDAPNTSQVRAHLEQAQALDESSNYLKTLPNKVIRWNDDTTQLAIYIHPPENIDNWTAEYALACQEAFNRWSEALNHKITFRFTNNKKEADVQVGWTTEQYMTSYGERAGYNEYELKDNYILKNDIYILVEYRKLPPVGSFYNIILHEAGHMMGIKQHSNNPVDVMAMAHDVSYERMELSQRDIATIQALYQRKPDYTNPKDYKLAGEYNSIQRKFGRPDISIKFFPIIWTAFPFAKNGIL